MTPASVRITGWGMYAPERMLTNADLEKLVDTSDEWIRTRTGIRERRVAAAHESTATLAAIAGKRAIAVAGLQPDDIDLILVATLTPDYWMPATAVLVKEAIGNRTAVAFDVMAACSGFVYGYAPPTRSSARGQSPQRSGHRRGAADAASSTSPIATPASCSATAQAPWSCPPRTSRVAGCLAWS